MPRSLVQSAGAQSTGGASALAVTLGAGTTAGNEVIVAIAGAFSSVPTWTVSDGTNTYTTCTGSRQTLVAGDDISIEVFHSNGVSGGITTITVTPSTAAAIMSVAVAEFTPSQAATPVQSAFGATGSGTAPSTGTGVHFAGPNVDMVVSVVSDNGRSSSSAQTVTAPAGWTDIYTHGSNGSNTLSVGFAWKAITGGSNDDATWTDTPSASWLVNAAAFNAAGGGDVQPVPVAAIARAAGSPSGDGAVFVRGPGYPSAPPPGAKVPTQVVVTPGPAAPPPGAVRVMGPGGPPALPPGAKLPPPVVVREAARPGDPGGLVMCRTPRSEPIVPFRPWTALPIRDSARPGDPGGIRLLSGRVPMGSPVPRPAVVREPARAGDPGRVQALTLPPPPAVPAPTGRRLVVRELECPPPAGGSVARRAPTPDVMRMPAAVRARQPDAEPQWLAGWAKRGSTIAPPAPRPPAAKVAALAAVPVPAGGVLAWRPTSRAEPPGALVPRPILVRELGRPGDPGRVVASHAAWDFALPELTPIFESAEAPGYRSMATGGFNTGLKVGVKVFRAKRVP